MSGTVPIPVASEPADEDPDEDEDDDPVVDEPDELEEPVEEEDPVELVEDDVELAAWVCCRALWIAAVSALLARVNASWLAMLARPCDSLVIAELIVVITASLFVRD